MNKTLMGIIYTIRPLSLKPLLILIIAYFAPIKEVVHVMFIFLAVDFLSGIWAAKKENQKIESIKLRLTVYKFIWYTVAVMAAWMMENTFKLSWSNLANITAGFICFVELKSIFENITRITRDPIFLKIMGLFRKRGSDTIHEIGDIVGKTENDNSEEDKKNQ